jgi:glycosyltransferase involved in cell wall biosynthesis
VPLARNLRFSAGMLGRLRALANESTVLHGHGLWLMSNIYPGIVARRQKVPLIVAPRGMLGPGALGFSRFRKQLMWEAAQKAALRAASCMHATSEQEYLDIRSFGLRHPVAIIPNGIDVPVATALAGHRNGTRTVLYLGRIHPKKGLDRLIGAWRVVEGQGHGWRLRIIGPDEGGYLGSLKRQSAELGLRRVSFEAPLFGDAKQDAYRDADIFVLPTLDENFAMTVAEALAQGTPVICTKGAPWSGLEANGSGWWIDHGIEALAAALSKAMAIPHDSLEEMGRRGRDWMLRDFSWDGVAQKMATVYGWLLHSTARPDFVQTN